MLNVIKRGIIYQNNIFYLKHSVSNILTIKLATIISELILKHFDLIKYGKNTINCMKYRVYAILSGCNVYKRHLKQSS